MISTTVKRRLLEALVVIGVLISLAGVVGLFLPESYMSSERVTANLICGGYFSLFGQNWLLRMKLKEYTDEMPHLFP